jgi:TRAP-type uncharacterized transport system fused permease subunit
VPDLRSPRVWLALVWSAFQLWTAYRGMFDLLIQLPLHVAFATALGFLSPPAGGRARWYDMIAAAAALACAAHYIASNGLLASRMAMVDDPEHADVVVGVLLAGLLLEAARRHIGPALVVLALGFVAYAFAGPWLPGFLAHGGESFLQLVDQIGASLPHIVARTLAATLGIVMLGAGLIGYLRAPTRPWERAVLLAGAVLLIFPGIVSDVIGVAGFVTVYASQRAARPAGATEAA